MKKLFTSITVLGWITFTDHVNANPDLCYNSAFTASEIEAVEILEDMYYIQSEIEATGESLHILNQQRRKGYNRYDSDSVYNYNQIINEYNDFISYKNKLSDEYNWLQESYNLLANQISPSTNIAFTTCLNSQILGLETNVMSLNIDSLNISTDDLQINTEQLRTNTVNLRNNLKY